MSASDAQDATDSFLDLERRLEIFCNMVPPVPNHNTVHSPVLASLLLDTGSLTESIFKSAMDNNRYSAISNIANIKAKRYSGSSPYYNINDSYNVFKSDQLYSKRVWYIPRNDSSLPWANWRLSQQKNPKWWSSYNNVKHNRFQNIKEAKLITVMHAVEAAFILLVQTLDFRSHLVSRGIIRSSGLSINTLEQVANNWERLPTQRIIIAKTAIFGYKFISDGSDRQATDISHFLI